MQTKDVEKQEKMKQKSDQPSTPESNGFATTASATENVKALQKALDGGGLVEIKTPGVYDLNDTIFLGSNTKLLCAPGVVFRKMASYCNVITNKGALTKKYDENITVEGLEISINGFEAEPTLVYGLRAQVGFHYVKNLTIKNFTCVDGCSYQYLMYIVTWERLRIEHVRLAGSKDGLKLNNGHDAIISDLDLTTYDDGMSICGTDYATTVVEVGDVYNVRYSNVTDHQYKNIFGRGCLIYTGSWADFTLGNEYRMSDFCLHEGRLYQCVNELDVVSTGETSPTHSEGIVTADDGVSWRYIQDADFHHTDVYNISFDNCTFEKAGNVVTPWIETSNYQRNYYPGTEHLSGTWGVSINNCRFNSKGRQLLLCAIGNLKDLTISNCVLDDLVALIRLNTSSSNTKMEVSVTGCVFKNMSGRFRFIAAHAAERVDDWSFPFSDEGDAGYIPDSSNSSNELSKADSTILLNCHMSGNSYSNSSFKNMLRDGAKIRMINMDLPFDTLEDLSPEKGDVCRTVDALMVFNGETWRDII